MDVLLPGGWEVEKLWFPEVYVVQVCEPEDSSYFHKNHSSKDSCDHFLLGLSEMQKT